MVTKSPVALFIATGILPLHNNDVNIKRMGMALVKFVTLPWPASFRSFLFCSLDRVAGPPSPKSSRIIDRSPPPPLMHKVPLASHLHLRSTNAALQSSSACICIVHSKIHTYRTLPNRPNDPSVKFASSTQRSSLVVDILHMLQATSTSLLKPFLKSSFNLLIRF